MLFFFLHIKFKFQSSVISHLGIADSWRTGNSDTRSRLMFGEKKRYMYIYMDDNIILTFSTINRKRQMTMYKQQTIKKKVKCLI